MDPSYYANLPAGAPPPGVTSDFNHPHSRAIEAHIGMGICMGVTLIFVLLRAYVKLGITHQWGWDDWACVIGFMLIVGHDAVAFTVMGPGKWLGTHIWDIRVISFTKAYFQSNLAAINLYAASALFVKLSLFLLYLRLFKPNRITRWLIYGGIVVCALFYSASIISNCALCMPHPGQPDDLPTWELRAGDCNIPSIRLALVQGVFGTLSDIYLLVVPIRSVFQLHLPTSRKLGVSAIFMTGIIAAEMSAGIVCGCMPVLAPLFRDGAGKTFPFPSLRYFLSSRFSSRSSRRPFVSDDKIRLAETPPPSKRAVASEQELSGSYIELERGTNLARADRTVIDAEGGLRSDERFGV